MTQANPKIIYPWHPDHLERKNPLIIEDLLEMWQSKRICAQKCKQMIGDLSLNGKESRYRKHLGGVLWELKDRTADGGARVYFLQTNQNQFFIYHAECKNENEATQTLLADGLAIRNALEKKIPIQPTWYGKRKKEV
jgi:UDP-2,3-diacylglucosamine pyrophosphatase LpxH